MRCPKCEAALEVLDDCPECPIDRPMHGDLTCKLGHPYTFRKDMAKECRTCAAARVRNFRQSQIAAS